MRQHKLCVNSDDAQTQSLQTMLLSGVSVFHSFYDLRRNSVQKRVCEENPTVRITIICASE